MSSTRTVSIKFRGKEVRNPFARKVVATFVFVVGVPLLVITTALVVALAPLLAITHLILRRCGRQGFLYHTRQGRTESFEIKIGPDGFKKRWNR